MRYLNGVDRGKLDSELLAALARFPQRAAIRAGQLAAELGEPVQSVTPRLRPLVRAGLVSKHWGQHGTPRGYMVSDEGHDYLARLEEPVRSATASARVRGGRR